MVSSNSRPWRRPLASSLLLLLLVASLLLLFSLLLSPFLLPSRPVPRIKRTPHLPLRFRYGGSFKILQVADMHFGNGVATRCRDVAPGEVDRCSDLNTTRFLRRVIDAEKPDLIAFTGDFPSASPYIFSHPISRSSRLVVQGFPWPIPGGRCLFIGELWSPENPNLSWRCQSCISWPRSSQ